MTLSAPTKKYLHGLLNTVAAGLSSWFAFSLPALVHLPVGVRGVLVALVVGIVSKTGGYIFGQVVQTTGETKS